MIDIYDIKYKTYKGTAGDLQTLLIGEYNGIEFSTLFYDSSIMDLSFLLARRRIIKAVKLLHVNNKNSKP